MAKYIMEEAAAYNVDEEIEPPSVIDHRPGWTWICNDVLYEKFDGLGDKARLAYIYLCSLSNGGHSKSVWPGRKWLAERLNCAERTVQLAIRELEGAGLVRVEPRFRKDGMQTSNYYHIGGGGEMYVSPGEKRITTKQDVSNKMVVKPVEKPVAEESSLTGVEQQPLLPEPVYGGVKNSTPLYPVKEEGLKNASTGVKQSGKDTQRDYAQKPKPAHAQLVSAYFNALESLGRVVDRTAFPRYVKTAKVLAQIGYTPKHVHEKTVEMGSQPFWKDKGLPIERVADALMVAPPQPEQPQYAYRVTSIEDDPFTAARNKRMKELEDDDAN